MEHCNDGNVWLLNTWWTLCHYSPTKQLRITDTVCLFHLPVRLRLGSRSCVRAHDVPELLRADEPYLGRQAHSGQLMGDGGSGDLLWH